MVNDSNLIKLIDLMMVDSHNEYLE